MPLHNPPDLHPITTGDKIALALALLLGTALRLYRLDHSFWIDEILTHMAASNSVLDILHYTPTPLSFLLSHFSIKVADTESLLRLPSFITGLLACWYIWRAGRTLVSPSCGIVAATLASVSPLLIAQSQEARYYSIMAFCAAASLYYLPLAVYSQRKRDYAKFTLVSIAGLFTHLFFVPFLLTFSASAFLMVLLSKAVATKARTLVLIALASGLALLPFSLFYLFHQTLLQEQAHLLPPRASATYQLTLTEYAYFLVEQLAHCGPVVMRPYNTPFFAMVILVLLGLALSAYRQRFLVFAFVGVLLILPIPFLILEVGHWYREKYFITQLPLLLVLAGAGAVALSQRIVLLVERYRPSAISNAAIAKSLITVLLTGVLASLHVTLLGNYYVLRQDMFPWKPIAQRISETIGKDDVVALMTSQYGDQRFYPYESHEPMSFDLQFYTQRMIPTTQVARTSFRMIGVASADALTSLALENPQSNIWLVHEHNYPSAGLYLYQHLLFKMEYKSAYLHLRRLGKPTVNLVPDGSFETSVSRPGIIRGDSRDGEYALELKAMSDTTCTEIALRDVETTLSKPYVFSGMTKCEHIPQKFLLPAAYVDVVARYKSGNEARLNLLQTAGTHDWKLMASAVHLDELTSQGEVKEIVLQIGNPSYRGRVLFDQLQLEQQDTPTPFVDGVRPPFDQATSEVLKQLLEAQAR